MGIEQRAAAHQQELQTQAQGMEFMPDFQGYGAVSATGPFGAIGMNAPVKDISYGDGFEYKSWFGEGGAPNVQTMFDRYRPQELAGGGFDFPTPQEMARGQMPTISQDIGGRDSRELMDRLNKFKEMFGGMEQFINQEQMAEMFPTQSEVVGRKTGELQALAPGREYVPFTTRTPEELAQYGYDTGQYG